MTPDNNVLNEDQISGLRRATLDAKSSTFHLHDWAAVIVVNHKGLDPVDMFILGQRFEFFGVRPQAVQLGAPNGETSTALVANRRSPGIPLAELDHFIRLLLLR